MIEVLMVIYLLVALALIGLILIQQGKGADMGASFGAGASNTIFGASGAGNFLTRTTAVLATVFFGLSLLLGNLTASETKAVEEWQDLSLPAEAQQTGNAPAADVPVDVQPKSGNNEDVPN